MIGRYTWACRLTVVRGVFLACDHSLRVEKRPVRTSLHVVNNARFKINIERPRDVFPRASLRKKGLEATIRVRWGAFLDTTIRLQKRREQWVKIDSYEPCSIDTHTQSMFQGVQLPYGESVAIKKSS
jgi:hypothetical protein